MYLIIIALLPGDEFDTRFFDICSIEQPSNKWYIANKKAHNNSLNHECHFFVPGFCIICGNISRNSILVIVSFSFYNPNHCKIHGSDTHDWNYESRNYVVQINILHKILR